MTNAILRGKPHPLIPLCDLRAMLTIAVTTMALFAEAKERSRVGCGKVESDMSHLAPGAVKPSGWLKEIACAVRDGYTAHMDEVDVQFRRAWAADTTPRGKDVLWNSNPGSWSCEGGAYWFDGLVRLAFQLDDPSLKTMVSNRLETVLTRTSEKTYGFCWWMRSDCPQDVRDIGIDGFLLFNAEKLESTVGAWYEATGDPRAKRALQLAFTQHVFDLMSKQRRVPLRGAVDAWRLTRDSALAARIDAACANKAACGRLWTVYGQPPPKGLEETLNLKYRHEEILGIPSRHGIGAHSALARLLCAYRWTGDEELLKTVRAWYDFFGTHCRQPFGHTVMDEEWGHAGPTRATETCTAAIENATRLELLATLGEGSWGDDVELSVFNLVPNCFSSDFRAHVYMQQPNRTRDNDLADCSHGGDPDPQGRPHTHGRYERKQYPLCCTAGLNRIFPDYIQAMWMKTSDGGIAASLYGPCTFETTLAGGRFAVREETAYPFDETVRFVVDAAPEGEVSLCLRLPRWCTHPMADVNGTAVGLTGAKGFATIARTWKRGDVVTLRLPMKPVFHTMHDWNQHGRAYGWTTLGPLVLSMLLPSADANTPLDPNVVLPKVGRASAEAAETVWTKLPVHWNRPDMPPVKVMLKDVVLPTLFQHIISQMISHGIIQMLSRCLIWRQSMVFQISRIS